MFSCSILNLRVEGSSWQTTSWLAQQSLKVIDYLCSSLGVNVHHQYHHHIG